MKDLIYRVAGLCFVVKTGPYEDIDRILPSYVDFSTESLDSETLFVLTVSDKPVERLPQKIDTFDIDGGKGLVCTDGTDFSFDIYEGVSGCINRMRCNGGFTEAVVCLDNIESRDAAFTLNNCLMIMFAFASSRKSALMVHSSVVVKDSKVYMFLGKSGTGKSTHSRLWLQNIDGTFLLNDDNPIVRLVDGKVYIYGSPWSGKTKCYINKSFEVGGIVRIVQKPFNRITKLNVLEAYASLISSCSILRQVPEVNRNITDTVSSVVGLTRCYVLECLPDVDAAKVSYSAVTA